MCKGYCRQMKVLEFLPHPLGSTYLNYRCNKFDKLCTKHSRLLFHMVIFQGELADSCLTN